MLSSHRVLAVLWYNLLPLCNDIFAFSIYEVHAMEDQPYTKFQHRISNLRRTVNWGCSTDVPAVSSISVCYSYDVMLEVAPSS